MWDNFARGQCCSWLSRSQKKNKGTSGSALYFQEFSRSCGLQIKLEYRCVKGFLRRGEDLGAQGITISSHKWHRADTLRKQPTFHITTTVFPVKWCFKSKGRHYILMMQDNPDLCWLKHIFNQSEPLPRSGWWCVISIEFLCLFLRRHLARKPQVVVSLNVNRFLWLSYLVFRSKTGAICHWRDLVSILCTTLLAGVKDNHHYQW